MKNKITKKQTKELLHLVKVVLLGSAVGKSNLLLRITQNRYDQYLIGTIGRDFYFQNYSLSDKSILKLKLQDSCGQERYRILTKPILREVQAVLLIFDITEQHTFQSIKDYWTPVLREEKKDNIIKVLIGNKIDLKQQRAVSRSIAEKYAQQNKMMYFEVSAKTGENIKEFQRIFVQQITSKIINKNRKGYQLVQILEKQQEHKNKIEQQSHSLERKRDLQVSRLILMKYLSFIKQEFISQ